MSFYLVASCLNDSNRVTVNGGPCTTTTVRISVHESERSSTIDRIGSCFNYDLRSKFVSFGHEKIDMYIREMSTNKQMQMVTSVQ